MRYCDLTLTSPAENLACDEVLLDLCDQGLCDELLRVWQPMQYFVVLGYGKKATAEVNLDFCRQNSIPVLRRCTGGGTVLQGPGCFNYSLVLRINAAAGLESIPRTNESILKRHQAALADLLKAHIELRGHTDLAVGGLKVSGNAQRRKKHFLLFHGTFLLHLDISLVEKALPLPAQQPDYRVNRSHTDFLVNLKLPLDRMKQSLKKCWQADGQLPEIPFDTITALARDKYAQEEWTFKF